MMPHRRRTGQVPLVVAQEAAQDLGAGPLATFFVVTLPLIAPAILAGFLLAFTISLDDFVITFFTIGSGNTLPTLVWGMVRTSLDPTINAIATLLLALSIGWNFVAHAIRLIRLTSIISIAALKSLISRIAYRVFHDGFFAGSAHGSKKAPV